MIFVAFQISSNHIQMTYYFLFVMLFMVIAFMVDAIRRKQLPDFLKSTAVLLVAGLIGIATNASNLYHTYEYSKETMRGKSELSHHGEENKTDNGLERDYITAWSYGVGETWTLLVPNTKGGASVPLSENERAMSKARPEYSQLYQQIGQYWGEQPGTSGPVYVGAFVWPCLFSAFHCERPDQMGTAGRNPFLDPAFMGKKLYAADRLLYRLRTHVQQVPHGIFHSGGS